MNQRSLPQRKQHNSQALTVPDPLLGYKTKEHLTLSSLLTINNDTIYNCLVSSDEHGWRTSPFDSIKSKQAVFLGCSFTFGEGLNDEQTLPYLVGKNSAYNTYNLACLGYGPQQALLLAKNALLPPAAETKVVYVYIDGHIQRANGTLSVVNSYGKNFPYPKLEDDSLMLYPSFEKKSPFLLSLYSALRDCQTMQYFNLDLPLFLREKHFELFGKTIEKLALEVKKKYKSDLILLIYPGSVLHEKVLEHININLIEVVDYSSLATKGDENYFFKTDGHPNALLNKIVAGRILVDIFR
ncbi:MAG: hypothetical protein NT150_14455 [Bacteroidetes bacterium]|nr:hypothetical protein [Bacteroidota bacterium]